MVQEQKTTDMQYMKYESLKNEFKFQTIVMRFETLLVRKNNVNGKRI